MPESPADRPGSLEWNCYRPVVGQLIADGHEGRWVLIRGPEVVGVWDSEEEANRVRLSRFLLQDVLMKQVGDLLNSGVRVLVALDPSTRSAPVHCQDAPQQISNGEERLTLPDVLPGFAVPVTRFFEG